MKKEITFIVNRSEITAGTRGASLGPDAVITAARVKNNSLFADHPLIELPNYNDLLNRPINTAFAKQIDGLIKVYTTVSESVSSELIKGNFPILLAGDHGSAGGTIAGIKKAFPTKRLGVIWIDAHGDLHTPFTTPSGNMHGMPLSTALNDDNLECKINDVPSETLVKWETLKNIGFSGAKIKPEDLVFIAVRDTEPEENAIIERLGIKNYTVEEVIEKGTNSIVSLVLERLKECEILYISFDVDSMDPKATSYGTGTPVMNGLMPKQARELLNGLGHSPKMICIEFVEVNPVLDEKMNRMAEVTFELIDSLVDILKK
jgi:arginase